MPDECEALLPDLSTCNGISACTLIYCKWIFTKDTLTSQWHHCLFKFFLSFVLLVTAIETVSKPMLFLSNIIQLKLLEYSEIFLLLLISAFILSAFNSLWHQWNEMIFITKNFEDLLNLLEIMSLCVELRSQI